MIGVFLSHSSKDKAFARRLGNDLRQYGAKVWIDEAEINIGDSLIEKISQGLSKTDYIVVLLSQLSCSSEWVKRELNIVLTKEIQGRKVKVLPCLLDDCEMPLFLLDKKYADFRNMSQYVSSRSLIVKALGLREKKDEYLFLDQHVFYDLLDLNDGFDSELIRYFSQSDFEIILRRAEFYGLEIYGIEPWPNKEFAGVRVYEEYNLKADNPKWYWAAFKGFLKEGITDYFSASYGVPKKIMFLFSKGS